MSYTAIEKPILNFLEHKLVQQNYAGYKILSGGGLLILFPCLLSSLFFFFFVPSAIMAVYILMLPISAFCGMLDDLLDDSLSKGLVQHFSALLKDGNFTTGVMKAFIGSTLGFLVAYSNYNGFFMLVLDILLFTLSMNLINLLDLRPGRAIKSFGFFIGLFTVLSSFSEVQFILPPLMVLMFYTKGEMNENYMLGDTGANLLGGILGFYGVVTLAPIIKMLLLILLISLHIFAELHSLSKTIARMPLLKKIDMLGRRQERGEQ